MARKLSAYNKFVKKFSRTYKGKNLMKAAARAWKGKGSKKRSRRKSAKKSNPGGRRTAKGKLFGSLSGAGLLEDQAWGIVGGLVMRSAGQGANAIPAARIVQGLTGYAMNRRGKQRLLYGISDYVDNWILSRVMGAPRAGAAKPGLGVIPGFGEFLNGLGQLGKLTSL